MTPLKATGFGYSPLHPGLSHSGYAIFIHEKALNFLNDAIQDDYASFKLIKKIISMRSNPRPWDSGIKKGATDHRQLAIDGVWVNYFIDSGCVYIDTISHNRSAKARQEPAGLHLVARENNSWVIKRTYLNEISTEYAAINGQNNSRDVAAVKVMPAQLEDAYRDEEIHEFTLFHAPTQGIFADAYESAKEKLGLTTPVTKSLSKLLQKAQQQQKSIKWVTHNQGNITFIQAVNAHNKISGSSLDKHTVFFQAPVGHLLSSKKVLDNAGIKLHKQGYNNNSGTSTSLTNGLDTAIATMLNRNLKSIARFALSSLALVPGLVPMSFAAANSDARKGSGEARSHAERKTSKHSNSADSSDKKVASTSVKIVKTMINRVA